ncbi:MAG: hypothetical protein WAU11_06315 [Ignavibacteriaceae bacterium]
MDLNKNDIISAFRKRIEILEKDRLGFKSYIERMREKIEDYEKKYSNIIRVSDYLNYMISNNHLNEIDTTRVFIYSTDDQKIYLINERLKNNEIVSRANSEIEETLLYYKNQVVEYARIVQLHINKLELLETTYFKLLYSIEYLEYGEDAIKINNDLGYSYYFILYYNSLTGYESSKERMNAVSFTKEQIEKFIYENSKAA